jgi:hypothetical protein
MTYNVQQDLPRPLTTDNPMAGGVVDDIHSKLALADVVVIEWGTAAETALVINQLLNGSLDRMTWSSTICFLYKCTDGVLLSVVVVAYGTADVFVVIVLLVIWDSPASLL